MSQQSDEAVGEAVRVVGEGSRASRLHYSSGAEGREGSMYGGEGFRTPLELRPGAGTGKAQKHEMAGSPCPPACSAWYGQKHRV